MATGIKLLEKSKNGLPIQLFLRLNIKLILKVLKAGYPARQWV